MIRARLDPKPPAVPKKLDVDYMATMQLDTLSGLARQKPPSLKVRFLPDFQNLLQPASGVWSLACGVFTSREA